MIDFSVEVGDLQRALASVQACIPNRSTMPILACVRLTASAGKIDVFASSVSMEAETEIAADVGRDGAIAVHGLMLASIVGKLPKSSTLTMQPIEDREGWLKISCGRATYRIAIMDAADMPAMEPIEGNVLTLKAPDLEMAIAAAAHCAAVEESRWHMAGLNLALDRDVSDLVCTGFDGGKRYSVVRLKLDTLPEGEIPSVTIPNFAIKAISAMCSEAQTIELRIERSRAEVRTDRTVLRTRLIDGEYPHDQIARIPPPTKRLFTVNADVLADAAQRASAVFRRINDNKVLPAIGLIPKGEELHVIAGGSRGVDEAGDVVAAENVERFPELALVTEQVIEALGVFKHCVVDVFQNAPGYPIAILAPEKPECRYFLAPMTKR